MLKKADHLLSPSALAALSKSLSLATAVLGFDIAELWSDMGDGRLHCTFVHATEEVVAKYPSIINGYFPAHHRAHMLSPLVR
jgi:hypothetical protein